MSAGCPATSDEVRPPPDQFYFPTGMDIAPAGPAGSDGSVLFVASSNSDLRFDSAVVHVVDLDRVDRLIGQWLDPAQSGVVPDGYEDCDVDLMTPYTLVCDEAQFLVKDASVRIGNFATDLKVQKLADDKVRLFVAARGDPSLTWIDYDREKRDLSCGEEGRFPECDDAHRLVQLHDDPDLPTIADEPFGLFVDSGNASRDGYVVVTHLSNGAVSLASAPYDGGAPELADAIAGLFQADASTGVRGTTGVAGRLPGSENDRIYVTSRTDTRVQTLIVVQPPAVPVATGEPEVEPPQLVPAESFLMSAAVGNGAVGSSTNGRGIGFSGDGNTAYIVNRLPPMLHIIDTSMTGGTPRNEFVAAVEICPQGSNLTVAGDRVFVACFANGQIWSIDPTGAVVDAIIDVGRGPNALVASPDGNRLYVTNNLEDTVAVIDLTPESKTRNQVVLRLGRPRLSSGEIQ